MQNSVGLQVNHARWDCFSALEQALEDSSTAINIDKNNYHLSSDHYHAIIIKSCAEIENIYQQVYGTALDVKRNISTHIHSMTEHCNDFFQTEIHMPMHDEMIQPWSACAEGKDPEFWSIYHAIKYEGALGKATLEQAIHSLAGLFSLLLVLDN